MTEISATGTTAYTRTSDGEPVTVRGLANTTSYYAHDSVGSVIGPFNKTGTFTDSYSYAPYGELRAASNTAVTNANTLRFAAGY